MDLFCLDNERGIIEHTWVAVRSVDQPVCGRQINLKTSHSVTVDEPEGFFRNLRSLGRGDISKCFPTQIKGHPCLLIERPVKVGGVKVLSFIPCQDTVRECLA